MKRKLDEHDQPVPAAQSAEPGKSETTNETNETTFADFGLDSRLLQAVGQQLYQKPTTVQAKSIPLILDGGDLLCRAKTGSGKTAAYLLPVLESILRRKQASSSPCISALVLVPTKELADQVLKNIETLSAFCKDLRAIKLSEKLPDSVQRSLLSSSPDIVVATPSRACVTLKSSAMSLDNLKFLVLDEADLVMSYGYEDDLSSIAGSVPKGVQTVLTSATLTPEVDTLKGLFCRNPTVLNLEEPEAEGEGVTQYVVKCGEDEKFLLICTWPYFSVTAKLDAVTYVLIKCQLIKGKSLVFVADVDRAYRLRLFFEQFGLRSCVLNSELPVNSRIHIVEEFNRGIYDIIIASDDQEALGNENSSSTPGDNEEPADADKELGAEPPKDADKAPPKKKHRSSRCQDKEYGISRGIDFRNVAMVLNFDCPRTAKSYQHRIGRTARGAGQTGTALTFIIPKEKYRTHIPTSVETAENDEKVLARMTKQQVAKGKEIKPYIFDMKQLEAFRYRMNDALRAVTKVSIREARTREIRQELLKSEKLKRHFEERPMELHHLRHDQELRAARTQAHLRHVPDYLLPTDGKKALTSTNIGFVPMKKVVDGKNRKGRGFKGKGKRSGDRKSDPLRSFKARPKRK
ncbi:Uu.00g056990.m01.CDS01 [Anthostomella pinea]|uniref:RNA helicase n=1 Tax=Anthostomella pinea TaxID=933095 RepID=A0AAI8YM58_9PEZI|nr:Uu.00g056990.m01.CDS01 [Anthostomella pinea]